MLLAESLLGSSSTAPVYIEDVFSTYLYTGTGASQTITNGVDLSTKGGMVWIKSRSAATNNFLFDTARGTTKEINSNTTDAEATLANSLTAFNTDGFTVNSATGIGVNAATYASWTFRKQAKFFDVVTYTGNGTAGRTISHNLGSVPGCIIVKSTSTAGEYWSVYHRSLGATKYLWLQDTMAASTSSTYWNDTSPTSSVFSVGTDGSVNGNGKTYVAYLFAHDAGGFGATGSDNVISCGSYTGNGSATGPTITLGYEPQWVMVKAAGPNTGNWYMFDNMRGMPVGINDERLYANTSDAEITGGTYISPQATGFQITNPGSDFNASGNTYIYIAIRRGPMKTPTTGTSVYNAVARSGTGAAATVTGAGFPPDLVMCEARSPGSMTNGASTGSRLQGTSYVKTASTNSEVSSPSNSLSGWLMDGISIGGGASDFNDSSVSTTYINWFFRRAPGFFDVVCYTGTGANRTVSHNLGVAPELMIVKTRNDSTVKGWSVYEASQGNTKAAALSSVLGFTTSWSQWNSTSPTSTVFTVSTASIVNQNGYGYVAYLFASCPGVSKVGSYTGTGTTKQIDCGFTGGARFVLIKRADDVGDWYVWDSTRGIVAGNDPFLVLNAASVENTTTDYVDTYSAGFEISSTAPVAINANGGTFIFWAVA